MTWLKRILVLCIFLLSCSPVLGDDGIQTFLEPYKAADLASASQIRLAKIYSKEGDKVKEGQVLAEFDTSVLLARLELCRLSASFHGAIDAARANVSMWAAKLATLQELEKSGNARPQELMLAQTSLSMAQAELLKAREARQEKQAEEKIILTQLEENKLLSPFAGTIVAVNDEEGELAGTDKVPIMTLVQLDPLLAVFHLSPAQAFSLKQDEEVRLVINNSSVQAKIEYIAPLIEPQSGTIAVRAVIPNTEGRLLSGSRATIELPSSTPITTSLQETDHGTSPGQAATD